MIFDPSGGGAAGSDLDKLAAEELPGRFLVGHSNMNLCQLCIRARTCSCIPLLRSRLEMSTSRRLAVGSGYRHDDAVTRWISKGHVRLIDTTVEGQIVDALHEMMQPNYPTYKQQSSPG